MSNVSPRAGEAMPETGSAVSGEAPDTGSPLLRDQPFGDTEATIRAARASRQHMAGSRAGNTGDPVTRHAASDSGPVTVAAEGDATAESATAAGSEAEAARDAGVAREDGADSGSGEPTGPDTGATASDAESDNESVNAATGAEADAAEADAVTDEGSAKDADGAASGTTRSGKDAETADVAKDDAGKESTDGERSDPWAAFAPAAKPAPGRVRAFTTRAATPIGRFLVHEWTLAALGSLVLAAVMTWPTLREPTTTIPQDVWDPTLQAWQMAWAGHALATDPTSLWNANAFFPERYSYAFSDTLFGYAPAGLVGDGPVAAVLRYNVIYVLIFALAFFGAYALARQLGTGRTGAAVAGAAFAYAPWRLGQAGHLHVLSIGGIALALAMLARGHGFSLRDGYRPDRRRWGWVLAGWLLAAWQISLGFGIGIPFAYVLLGVVVVSAGLWIYRRRRVWTAYRPFGWKLFFANLGGGLVFAAVGGLMAYPYLRVLEQHPYARRSENILALFSPPLEGFFIAPPESWLWGESYAAARAGLPWAPEMALLPGFFLYGLAFAGLFVSVWSRRHRLLLGLGVVVSVVFAMGTKGPVKGEVGYLLLYRLLPGFDGIRTPGRLVLWTTLLLALLAGGAVTALVHRAIERRAERGDTAGRPRAGFVGRVATLVPLALVLVEGAHVTPHPVVPTSPVAIRTVEGPMIMLPSDELGDMNVMLWSTDGFPKMANGGSGFTPKRLARLRNTMWSFPDSASVDALRELGIRTVVVARDRVVGTPFERAVDAPIDGLGLTRTESGAAILYKVD